MSEDIKYKVIVRDRQKEEFFLCPSPTLPPQTLFIASPVPLVKPGANGLVVDELRNTLFEKVAQTSHNRERNFAAYRKRLEERLFDKNAEPNLLQTIKLCARTFRDVYDVIDIAEVDRRRMTNSPPQLYAIVETVGAIPSNAWTIRYAPGFVENVAMKSPYMSTFESLECDEKHSHISEIFLCGGPGAEDCAASLEKHFEFQTAKSKAIGSERNASEKEMEEVLKLIRDKYDFQQMLTSTFSRNELKEMDAFLHTQDKLSVHPLMRMVQHTSTIYVPDEIRSYALDIRHQPKKHFNELL